MTSKYFFNYVKLARLDKPVGILLLLWPTIWALILSSDGDQISRSINILYRSGFIEISWMRDKRHFDQDIDSQVKRTSDRPLAKNELTLKNASIFLL